MLIKESIIELVRYNYNISDTKMADCKKACTVVTLIWSFLVFYGFWIGLILGYSYFAWSAKSDLKDLFEYPAGS